MVKQEFRFAFKRPVPYLFVNRKKDIVVLPQCKRTPEEIVQVIGKYYGFLFSIRRDL